jgi:hypothetical protein
MEGNAGLKAMADMGILLGLYQISLDILSMSATYRIDIKWKNE